LNNDLLRCRHEDIIIPFIDEYEKDGTFDAEFAEKARKQTKEPHDGESVGRVLLKVLGVACSESS
jgi:hypothetical protein